MLKPESVKIYCDVYHLFCNNHAIEGLIKSHAIGVMPDIIR